MSDTLTIILSGKDYTVRKLTLRQARELGLGAIQTVTSAEDGFAELINRAVSIVAVALSRDHAELTPDAILELETTPDEIIKAYGAEMQFAGFVSKKANGTGEAVAAPESTGAASLRASLPH